MKLLNKTEVINKQKLIDQFSLGKYLKNSIINLKAKNFYCFKSKNYLKKFKYSLITIIFDTNYEEYFFKNINSLLNQSLKDIEIIILSNGASDMFLKKLNKFLKDKDNISLVINPFPEYDTKELSLYDPVFGLGNLGLLLAKGDLITWLSWDDEINKSFCEEIYKEYKVTNHKCFAPIPKGIDHKSNIIQRETLIMRKSFEELPQIISSKEVIKSKIGKNKEEIFKSPGELLAFERNHLISRQGYDFDFDLSQYLKVSAGEKIVIVKKAFLFWRYHKNQSHFFLKFNKSHVSRIRQIYHATDIYNLHKKLYGSDWAKSINYYYKYTRIVRLLSKNFICSIHENNFYPFKLFNEVKQELNLLIIFLSIIKIINWYKKKYLDLLFHIMKNPKKIFKMFKNYS